MIPQEEEEVTDLDLIPEEEEIPDLNLIPEEEEELDLFPEQEEVQLNQEDDGQEPNAATGNHECDATSRCFNA